MPTAVPSCTGAVLFVIKNMFSQSSMDMGVDGETIKASGVRKHHLDSTIRCAACLLANTSAFVQVTPLRSVSAFVIP